MNTEIGYIYIYIHIYTHIYIYIERERIKPYKYKQSNKKTTNDNPLTFRPNLIGLVQAAIKKKKNIR